MSIGFLPGAISRAAATLFIVCIVAGIALVGMTGIYVTEHGWLAGLTFLGPIVAAMLVKRKIVEGRWRVERAAWRVLSDALYARESIWDEFFPWGRRCNDEKIKAVRKAYPEWSERLATADQRIKDADAQHRPLSSRTWAARDVSVFLPATAITAGIHAIVYFVS